MWAQAQDSALLTGMLVTMMLPTQGVLFADGGCRQQEMDIILCKARTVVSIKQERTINIQ